MKWIVYLISGPTAILGIRTFEAPSKQQAQQDNNHNLSRVSNSQQIEWNIRDSQVFCNSKTWVDVTPKQSKGIETIPL